MLTTLEHGFSPAAVCVEEAQRHILQHLNSSVSSPRQEAMLQLGDIQQSCRSPNWDGSGAEPIGVEALNFARMLIEMLPNGLPLPSISAEPDGHIELEWYRSANRVLSVSVSPEGKLYWAALIGTEDPRGSCRIFTNRFPQAVYNQLRRIV